MTPFSLATFFDQRCFGVESGEAALELPERPDFDLKERLPRPDFSQHLDKEQRQQHLEALDERIVAEKRVFREKCKKLLDLFPIGGKTEVKCLDAAQATQLFDDNWPAWEKESGRQAAVGRLVREVNEPTKHVRTGPSVVAYFPVVEMADGVAPGTRGRLVRIEARTVEGYPGCVFVSPGTRHPSPGRRRHQILSRKFDASAAKAFGKAAKQAISDSQTANPPGVEVFIDGVNGSGLPPGDAACSLSGESWGLAVYVVVRAALEGVVQSGAPWCFSARVEEFGLGEVDETYEKLEVVRKVRQSHPNLTDLRCVLHPAPNAVVSDKLDVVAVSLADAYDKFVDQPRAVRRLLEQKAEEFASKVDFAGVRFDQYEKVRIYVAGQAVVTTPRRGDREGEKRGDEAENILGQSPQASVKAGRERARHTEDDSLQPTRQRQLLSTSLLSRGLTFLRGAPGLGKTFALQRLYRLAFERWAAGKGRLPVHVLLPELVNASGPLAGKTPEELDAVLCRAIAQAFAVRIQNRSEDAVLFLERTLRETPFDLIADGIDEVPDADREGLLAHLQKWQQHRRQPVERGASRDAHILVAGRKYGFHSTAPERGGNSPWRDLEPLDRIARRSIVDASLGLESDDGKRVLELERRPLLKQVLEVPVLFSSLVAIATTRAGRELLRKEHITPAMVLYEVVNLMWKRTEGETLSWESLCRIALKQFDEVLRYVYDPDFPVGPSVRVLKVREFWRFGKQLGVWSSDDVRDAWLLRLKEAKILAPTDGDLQVGNTRLVACHRFIWEFMAGLCLAEALSADEFELDYLESAAWAPDFEEVLVLACDALMNVVMVDKPREAFLVLERVIDRLVLPLEQSEIVGFRDALVWRMCSSVPGLVVATRAKSALSIEVEQALALILERRCAELCSFTTAFDLEGLSCSPRTLIQENDFLVRSDHLSDQVREFFKAKFNLLEQSRLGELDYYCLRSSIDALSIIAELNVDFYELATPFLREVQFSSLVGNLKQVAKLRLVELYRASSAHGESIVRQLIANMYDLMNADGEVDSLALGVLVSSQPGLGLLAISLLERMVARDSFMWCRAGPSLAQVVKAEPNLAGLAWVVFREHYDVTAQGTMPLLATLAMEFPESVSRVLEICFDRIRQKGLRTEVFFGIELETFTICGEEVNTLRSVLCADHSNAQNIMSFLKNPNHLWSVTGSPGGFALLVQIALASDELTNEVCGIIIRSSVDDNRSINAIRALGELGRDSPSVASIILAHIEKLLETDNVQVIDAIGWTLGQIACNLTVQASVIFRCCAVISNFVRWAYEKAKGEDNEELREVRVSHIDSLLAEYFAAIREIILSIPELAEPLLEIVDTLALHGGEQASVEAWRLVGSLAATYHVSAEQVARIDRRFEVPYYQTIWSKYSALGIVCDSRFSRQFESYADANDSIIEADLLGVSLNFIEWLRVLAETGFRSVNLPDIDLLSCVFRFWAPLCSGPNHLNLRLFYKTPPGASQHGFEYVRTVEELLGPLRSKPFQLDKKS